jgi:FdhD protein
VPEAISTPVVRVRGDSAVETVDEVAVELPLEIRLRLGDDDGDERVISTTMRTPGADEALALGFMLAEGILGWGDFSGEDDATRGPAPRADCPAEHVVRVTIAGAAGRARAEHALEGAARRFVTSSACGVCGRESLAALLAMAVAPPRPPPIGSAAAPELRMAADQICALPARLRERQSTFTATGGLHAAGAFGADGRVTDVHEDVGRHNAVDKLVGSLLQAGRNPARAAGLVVSGRASFELVQKAARAGFSMLVAVGAPSSLAIEVAAAVDMTLVGFVRDRGFNIYTVPHRLVLS